MAAFLVYGAAALAEIGGCFAFWAWLRSGASAPVSRIVSYCTLKPAIGKQPTRRV